MEAHVGPEVRSRTRNDGHWIETWDVRAIFFGSLAGFATALFMAVLGAAVGATSTAAIAPNLDTGDAKGMAIGALVWIAVTAILTGVVGGSVMRALTHHDVEYRPVLFGFLTWAGGILLAAILGVTGVGLTGSGAMAGGGVAAHSAIRSDVRTNVPDATRADATRPDATSTDRAEIAAAAERAAKAAAGLAWAMVIAQVLGLVATIVTARANPKGSAKTTDARMPNAALRGG